LQRGAFRCTARRTPCLESSRTTSGPTGLEWLACWLAGGVRGGIHGSPAIAAILFGTGKYHISPCCKKN
jgi:hypothetical protein